MCCCLHMNAYAAKDKKRKKRNDATKTDDDEKEGRAKRKTFIDTSTPESLTRDFYAWLYNNDNDDDHDSYKTATTGNNIDCIKLENTDESALFSLELHNSPTLSSDILLQNAGISSDDIDQKLNFSNDDNDAIEMKKQRKRHEETNKYGRIYLPGKPLSMSTRDQIVELHQHGNKVGEIAKLLCITHSCVSKIIRRFLSSGIVEPKPCVGNAKGRAKQKNRSTLIEYVGRYYHTFDLHKPAEIRKRMIADGLFDIKQSSNNTFDEMPSLATIAYIIRKEFRNNHHYRKQSSSSSSIVS